MAEGELRTRMENLLNSLIEKNRQLEVIDKRLTRLEEKKAQELEQIFEVEEIAKIEGR